MVNLLKFECIQQGSYSQIHINQADPTLISFQFDYFAWNKLKIELNQFDTCQIFLLSFEMIELIQSLSVFLIF